MVEKWLAAIGLLVCVGMLLGMALGSRRRARLLAAVRGVAAWPEKRRAARREAERAIERARRSVERDGNVYRPKSFDRRPPDEPLH